MLGACHSQSVSLQRGLERSIYYRYRKRQCPALFHHQLYSENRKAERLMTRRHNYCGGQEVG